MLVYLSPGMGFPYGALARDWTNGPWREIFPTDYPLPLPDPTATLVRLATAARALALGARGARMPLQNRFGAP